MDPNKLNAAALLENLHTGVVVHAPDTRILYANPRALELLRLTEEQAFGIDAFDPSWHFLDRLGRTLPSEDYPVNRVIEGQAPVVNQEVGIREQSNEDTTWVLCNAYPELNALGDIKQIVVTFIDISYQKKRIPFESIVELANDMVVVMEPAIQNGKEAWQVVYTNRAFTQLMGYSRSEIYGHCPLFLHETKQGDAHVEKLNNAMQAHRSVREQMPKRSKTGEEFWIDINLFPLRNEYDDVAFYAAIERDVTSMKHAEEKLHRLSVRDPLTNLLNRRGFEELAAQAVKISHRDASSLCFAMVDIDHFKDVNDGYGHQAGDLVLNGLAKQLSGRFRESDIVARLGGEEFGILMINTGEHNARQKLEQLRQSVADAVLTETEDGPLRVTISAGLYVPDNNQPGGSVKDLISELLSRADKALYAAKENGRNQVVTWQTERV
jgi:diguanylate cyclase (GGDEF)-like protein/PAS domain S-box-containing protein